MERVYLSPPSEVTQDKMTTLVDVIFVDFLDAGSIPATSTIRQGSGWHDVPIGAFPFAKVARRSCRSLRRRIAK